MARRWNLQHANIIERRLIRIEVVGAGVAVERTGVARPGAFEHIALEFDVPPTRD